MPMDCYNRGRTAVEITSPQLRLTAISSSEKGVAELEIEIDEMTVLLADGRELDPDEEGMRCRIKEYTQGRILKVTHS